MNMIIFSFKCKMSHINLFDLDLNNLKVAKSGRAIKLLYNKEPLQIVTGKMYTPFGVKVNTNSYSSFTTCHIDCSLNQSNSELSISYRNALEALDLKIIELLQDSIHLFNTGNSSYESDDISSIYSPILRENKTFPKLMKISLPRDSRGNFECVIFNEMKEKIFIDDSNVEQVLCKGKIFKGIIECSKFWYYNGRFGTTWNIKQLKFVENKIERESDDNNNNNSQEKTAEIYQSMMLLD